MAPPKKYTQLIFNDIQVPFRKKLHGELGLMYQFFEDLTRARKSKRLTQKEFAKKAKKPQSYIAKLEAGRENPTLHQLVALAESLDLKIGLVERHWTDQLILDQSRKATDFERPSIKKLIDS